MPQSVQSVPKAHALVLLKDPPSSQIPSDAYAGIAMHSFVHVQLEGTVVSATCVVRTAQALMCENCVFSTVLSLNTTYGMW